MEPVVSPLLTDLYQLTMLQAYLDAGMTDIAVFEFFVRSLPSTWNFLIAAGLDDVLSCLEQLQFTHEELAWLAKRGFSPTLIHYLEKFRFTGDVDAMPEGTVFFPLEPILRVTASLPQAQLIETRLINLLQYQTLVASKAARSRLVAPNKLLVEFGMRRAHGAEAALLAARASYIAGFQGTSNVLAGMKYGIPTYGTMAHSFIQAHPSETEAFLGFARSHQHDVVLLIDTYDTERGAERVVEIAKTLQQEGTPVQGVRLDSGDLADHAVKVRAILNRGGLQNTTIFASGNLDEWKLRDLLAQQAQSTVLASAQSSTYAPMRDTSIALQAAGICWSRTPKAVGRQSHLARTEAGLPSA